MRHLPGQAARSLWIVTHRLLTLALTLAVLGTAALGLLAWRLSQGPLEVAWLARRVEAAANASAARVSPTTLAIGSAALAWEGFRNGVDRPLDIRLRAVTGTDASGVQIFSIPSVDVSLSLSALLFGRLEPRAIELRNAQLRANRAVDGALSIDLGSLLENTEATDATAAAPAENPVPVPSPSPPPVPSPATADTSFGDGAINALVAELARPAANDLTAFRASRFSQLRRVLISDSALTVVDRQLGTTWRAARVDLDLRRHTGGGVDGTADVALAMGPETALLHMRLALAPGAQSGRATATVSPIAPAALARLSPALSVLGMLDAPVSLDATLDLGAALAIREGVLQARVSPGRLLLGDSQVVLRQAAATFAVTGGTVSLRQLRVDVAPSADGPVSILSASGTLGWDGAQLQGRGRVGIDRVAFADLPTLWPARISKNAREWVTRNITTGLARDAQVEVAITASADFTQINVTEVKGGLDAEDLSVHWLRPVPPIEKVKARLVINDPDVLDIITETGRQRLENARGEYASGLTSTAARVRITGLSQRDQIAYVDLDLAGPVADVITLLRHPRLRLLDRSPFELKEPAGSLTGHLSVTVPLEHYITLDDVIIHAKARTDGLRLAGVVAGRDLEQGVLDLDATSEMVKISGHATVARILAQLSVDMDLKAGGPAQVQQRITASARADIRQMAAAAGLDAASVATGNATAQLTFVRRRDGNADMRISGDLRETVLNVSPLSWRKPSGQPGSLEARLRIQRDRVMAIEEINLTGDAFSLRGRLDQVEGRLALMRLERAVLGRTEARGTITFQPGGRMVVAVQGPSIDLAPRLTEPTASAPPAAAARAENQAEAPWTLDARFDTAILANDVKLSGFSAQGESNGTIIQRLHVDGRTGAGTVQLRITTDGGGRRLTATSNDAGTLLHGLDVAHKISGGMLSVEGTYDDRAGDHPLTGSARIDEFRVMNAPAVTGLLQAMTLYGLVQMAQGPGLGVTKLIAPFRLTEATLDLNDARAFNPSLGMTIKGRIDRIREICDLNGTIVPAYFFNSLLGDIPLIGKLFSPEAGGGLFAASYTVRGPLAKPDVGVNPLSALTPGFLRGLFGNF